MTMRTITLILVAAGLIATATGAAAIDRAQIEDLIVQCAACHGADGVARDVEVPNLAGQHDRYLYNQLLNFRSGRRPHKEMRYMSRHLTEEEMDAIAVYYSKLPR